MITIILICFASAWFIRDAIQRHTYQRRLRSVPIRVHVNGIRGKTSLTRYITTILREEGYKVFAKTTGTAARIIDNLGGEMAIHRQGKPNISEQRKIMSYFLEQKPDAVIVECMAINPRYSEYLENKIMDSNIYIFSNIFIDHVDQLGGSVEEIAESMCIGFPTNATIITAESNPDVLHILKINALKKNSRLINANEIDYSLNEINGFNHVPVENNIKLSLAFASLMNIKRERILSSIKNCNLDEGQSEIKKIPHPIRDIQFANFFAVNDTNSFESMVKNSIKIYPSHQHCIILNNRIDRYERTNLFLKSILRLNIRYIVALGECGHQVAVFCQSHNIEYLRLDKDIDEARLLNGKDLIDCMISFIPGYSDVMLIGAVNIHSPQSHSLLKYVNSL